MLLCKVGLEALHLIYDDDARVVDDDDDDDGFINVSRGEHHCLIDLALIAGTRGWPQKYRVVAFLHNSHALFLIHTDDKSENIHLAEFRYNYGFYHLQYILHAKQARARVD